MPNSTSDVRYCKKCGCELTSTSKHKLCDDCRRIRAKKVRHGLEVAGGLALSAVLLIIPKGKNK